MALADARKILRVPGRLCISPTDLDLAWPHGGTGLGPVIDIVFRRFSQDYPITAEDFGGAPIEYLQAGSVYGCMAFARGWDDDTVDLIFPNTATGAVSGKTTVSEPGANIAGRRLSADAQALVFTPEGSTHAKVVTKPDSKAPFWILYAAIPMMDETAEYRMHRTEDLGVPMLFMGIQDGSNRLLEVGPRADLSL